MNYGFQIKWADEIGPSECPMMIRWVLNIPIGSLRLHHFLRSDTDRHPHDHPWWFVTVVLKGKYEDRTPCPDCRSGPSGPYGFCDTCHGFRYLVDQLGTGSIRFRPALHRHWVHTDGCWTLIITGRNLRKWGFWENNKIFRPVVEYFRKYGYAPCE